MATALPDEDIKIAQKKPLTVIQDNKTRWNSIYSMILQAFLLKDAIDIFIKQAQEKPAKDSPLSKDNKLSQSD
jgi:hypothetical protein